MIENSFKGYISLFIFYIIPVNYAIYIDQNLIFGFSWIQNTIISINKEKGTYSNIVTLSHSHIPFNEYNKLH